MPSASSSAGPWPPIRNRQGERLACSWVPGGEGRREFVVIGHGLTSDKRRPWSVQLSDALAARGIGSLAFAFSGNGESEGRFEDSTITKEVDDLGAVLDVLQQLGLGPIAYAGHSMGAAVGVLQAACVPRLAALVSLAGMVHTAEFLQRLFGQLALGEPMLGKPRCPFGAALRDDLLTLGSVVDRAPAIAVPWLLVHGTADDVVPIGHARDIHHAAGGRAELVELPGVDHSFTGDGLPAMLAAVVPWLAARLAAPAR